MRLMLITDCRRACPEAPTVEALMTRSLAWLAEAVDSGIDVIQIREPGMDARHVVTLARGLVAMTAGTRTRVVINNRVDVMLAAGAHGVHLRDDGWPYERVRGLVGPETVVGRSIHAVQNAADHATTDYLVFGAVFGSGDKPAAGVQALAAVASASVVPVFAVGGVQPGNVAACARAGAAGVAAITPFLPAGIVTGALGPRDAVARLSYS